MFVLKTKNVQTLNYLLVKKGEDFLDLKILITKDHSSLNSILLNLLFWFTYSKNIGILK